MSRNLVSRVLSRGEFVMREEPIKAAPFTSVETKGEQGLAMEGHSYSPPVMYAIGRSSDLLQGSGRHKNDDTGSRGFIVDRY
jgi:hypothetical protein